MENKRILDSWKEIAAYLKRSEKTCRNWEHALGLPVHRLDGSPKARVFAYEDEIDHWLKETQDTREHKRSAGRKKFLIPGLVFLAVVIAGILIWRVIPRRQPPLPPSSKPSLAVLYFENNTGDKNLDYWQKALSDLFITDLSQSKYLNVLPGPKLLEIHQRLNQVEVQNYSAETIREIAEKGDVNKVIRGSYSKAGDTFRLDIVLQDATTGEAIASERAEGVGEKSFFSMVDSLTKTIKPNLDLSKAEIAADLDEQMELFFTNSPEAYKNFSEGVRLYFKGQQDAIPYLEKAVAIDPDFAWAYLMLGNAYYVRGTQAQARYFYTKAFDLSNRLPESERMKFRGFYYQFVENNYKAAIEAYNRGLEIYPDDSDGINSLGMIYQDIEDFNKSREYFKAVYEMNKIHFYMSIGHYNLSLLYINTAQYDLAKDVAEEYIDKSKKDDAWIRLSLALNSLCQGKYQMAHEEAEHIFSLSPGNPDYTRMKGYIYHCQDDYEKAENQYRRLMGSGEQDLQLDGLTKLGYMLLSKGQFNKCEEFVKQGLDSAQKSAIENREMELHFLLSYLYLNHWDQKRSLAESAAARRNAVACHNFKAQIRSNLLEGLAYIKMGELEKAHQTAQAMKSMIDESLYKKQMRYYFHLMGNIALGEKSQSKAISHFQTAERLTPYQWWNEAHDQNQALLLESLAYSYYVNGDLRKALERYEAITHLTLGRLDYGDIYAKSFYMLGKIAEQQGRKLDAIERYRKFLDLWKDADPGLPEVEDAKKRLAALEAT